MPPSLNRRHAHLAHQRRRRLIAIKHTVATATAEIAVKSAGFGDVGAVVGGVDGVGVVGEGIGVAEIPIILS